MIPPSLAKLLVEPQVLTPRQAALLLALRGVSKAFTEAVEKIVPAGSLRDEGFGAVERAFLLFETAIRSQTRSQLSPDVLALTFRPTEDLDLRVKRVWMNANAFGDLRKHGRELIDPESDAKRLRKGIQGKIWGTEIRTSRHIPDGQLVVVGEIYEVADLSDEETVDRYFDLKPGWKPTPEQLVHY